MICLGELNEVGQATHSEILVVVVEENGNMRNSSADNHNFGDKTNYRTYRSGDVSVGVYD